MANLPNNLVNSLLFSISRSAILFVLTSGKHTRFRYFSYMLNIRNNQLVDSSCKRLPGYQILLIVSALLNNVYVLCLCVFFFFHFYRQQSTTACPWLSGSCWLLSMDSSLPSTLSSSSGWSSLPSSWPSRGCG